MLEGIVQQIGQTVRHLAECVVQVDGHETLGFFGVRGVRLVVVVMNVVEVVRAPSGSVSCGSTWRGKMTVLLGHSRVCSSSPSPMWRSQSFASETPFKNRKTMTSSSFAAHATSGKLTRLQ